MENTGGSHEDIRPNGASTALIHCRPRVSAARRAAKADGWVTTRDAPWVADIMSA